jgi:hypothetical protein
MLSSLDHNYLQSLVEKLSDIIIAVDRDGTIISTTTERAKSALLRPGNRRKITVIYPHPKKRAA